MEPTESFQLEPVVEKIVSEKPKVNISPSQISTLIPSFHPTYLLANYFAIYNKKIIIGYSTNFEVKICVIQDKRNSFIEFSHFGFANLCLNLEAIYRDCLNNEKTNFIFEHERHLKISSKNGESFANLEDSEKSVRVIFNQRELAQFQAFRNTFLYVIQKFIFNKSSLQAFYSNYINAVSTNGSESMEAYNLLNQGRDGLFNIDITQLFYELPAAIPFQIEKDKYFASIAPQI